MVSGLVATGVNLHRDIIRATLHRF